MLSRQESSKTHKKFELFIKAKDLSTPTTVSPVCKLQWKVEDGNWIDLNSTEIVTASTNPQWKQTMIIDHYFESNIILLFSIYSGLDLIGSVECSTSNLIARQPFISHIFRGAIKEITGTIIIKAEEVRDIETKLALAFKGHHFDGLDLGGKSDPYFKLYKSLQDGTWLECYKSETVYKTIDPEWPPFEINLHKLCNSDSERLIKIECYDWDRCTADDYIGQATITLRDLLNIGTQFPLINHKKETQDGYLNSGVIEVTHSELIRDFSYMDYLQNGTSIKLMVAIDFTSSNGDHADPHSLHYSNSSIQNEYQRAIEAISRVLEVYDEEKQFSVYGFGGRPNWTRDVNHCFALTRNDANPYVAGIEQIIDIYLKELPNIELAGPTYFRHVIEMATAKAREKIDGSVYNVLLILTDGDIDDFPATRSLVVEASRLPISIIIVGVGGECFSNMLRLDSDSGTLKDRNQNEAVRDIVQFVPFRQFSSSYETFQHKILEEIPSQIESYMRLANITPLRAQNPFEF